MKTSNHHPMTPRTKARPKARAQKANSQLWAYPYEDGDVVTDVPPSAKDIKRGWCRPVVLLDLPLPQAKKLRDFANLSEEERVEALYPFVCEFSDVPTWKERARSILSAIGL